MFQLLPIPRPSGKIVPPEHINPWVPSSAWRRGIPKRVLFMVISCNSLKKFACWIGPSCSRLSARVKNPPNGPIPSINIPSVSFRQLSLFSSIDFPNSSIYTHGIFICPTFSSRVIRARRSSTLSFKGYSGFLYFGSCCPETWLAAISIVLMKRQVIRFFIFIPENYLICYPTIE